jgi:hypothetical protein
VGPLLILSGGAFALTPDIGSSLCDNTRPCKSCLPGFVGPCAADLRSLEVRCLQESTLAAWHCVGLEAERVYAPKTDRTALKSTNHSQQDAALALTSVRVGTPVVMSLSGLGSVTCSVASEKMPSPQVSHVAAEFGILHSALYWPSAQATMVAGGPSL